MKLPQHSTTRPSASIDAVKSHKDRHTRQHGRGNKTTKISFQRYTIDGTGTIVFPDGSSGTVWVFLHVDPDLITNDSFITGREDLIAAAIKHGCAELRLADGAYLNVSVTPLNNRYAAIKLITTDSTVPRFSYQEPIFEIIKSTLPRSLCFIGAGVLRVTAEYSGPVGLQAHSIDDCVPGVLEISGESRLIDAAYHRATVRLELCGLTFRARVIGQRKDTGALLIPADAMFRAMARSIKELTRH
jgi:hypothetical protein